MEKYLFLSVIAFFLCISLPGLQAQSLISTASHNLTADGYSFSGSMGEPLTMTLTSEKQNQTQGFHQPDKNGVICQPCDLVFDEFEILPAGSLDFSFSPNPAQSFISLDVRVELNSTQLKLAIYDSSGKVHYLENLNDGSEKLLKTIDVSMLNSGQYFIRLYNVDQSIIQSFNISQ